jgi:hypothetical protein
MAGVNVKMGVTGVSEFKRSMKDSESAVKALNAQLALNESQLKLNGNAELYMENKAALLNQKIAAQAAVAKAAKAALEDMKKNGVSETSAAFQTMQTKLYNATNEMVKTKTELQNVKNGTDGAKEGARGMNTELGKIGKGISWENVTNGIHSVTQSLESAGRAAISAGRKLLNSFTGATNWADDVTTRATKYGVSTEDIQRMDQAADIIDTDVDTIMTARNRLANNKKGLGELLGLEGTEGMSLEDQFWAAGEAIMAMTDEAERADKAQDVFGKSWQELVPLFAAGREAYDAALEGASVLSDEQVEKLSKADDTIKQLETQVENLKRSFWAENADNITKLMQWLIDNKDGVITALTAIGAAFGALKIADLATNLTKVIKGFSQLGLINGGQTTTAAAGQAGSAAAPAAGAASTGGGWMTGLMNNLVSGMGTSFVLGEEAKIRGMVNNFISGLSQEEAKAKGFQQTFGITQEEFDEWANQRNLEKQGSGASFEEVKYVTPVSDEIIHKDRRGTATVTGGAYESVDRMNEVASEMTDATQNQTNATNDMAAAAKSMTGLPALVGAAVQAGVSGIKVMMDGYTVGTLVAPTVSAIIAQNAK